MPHRLPDAAALIRGDVDGHLVGGDVGPRLLVQLLERPVARHAAVPEQRLAGEHGVVSVRDASEASSSAHHAPSSTPCSHVSELLPQVGDVAPELHDHFVVVLVAACGAPGHVVPRGRGLAVVGLLQRTDAALHVSHSAGKVLQDIIRLWALKDQPSDGSHLFLPGSSSTLKEMLNRSSGKGIKRGRGRREEREEGEYAGGGRLLGRRGEGGGRQDAVRG